MILQSLLELYNRLAGDPAYQIPPPGRSIQKMKFAIVLHPDGRLHELQDIQVSEGRKSRPRLMIVPGITKPTGSGLNPCFLWDNTAYLLGWDSRADRAERARKQFAAWRDAHLSVERAIDHPEFSAICRFAETWDPANADQMRDLLERVSTGFGCFQIIGRTSYVHDNDQILSWWDKRTCHNPDRMKRWATIQTEIQPDGAEANAAEPGEPTLQCLLTGKIVAHADIARLHPKIKGVAGAQSSGATIAGFNDPAYESWGHEQSYNAPVSQEAARRYVAALNALLDGPMRQRHRLDLGSTTVVFWTDRPSAAEGLFAQIGLGGLDDLQHVQDEYLRSRLEQALRAIRAGRQTWRELDASAADTRFYILGLAAPAPARIAVRFFRESTVADLLDRLWQHFSDVRIERQFGDDARRPEPRYPSFRFLLDTLRPPGGDPPPLLAPGLVESIVTGRQYPPLLYQATIRRLIADRNINYARACLIKGHLTRNLGKEISVTLDPSNTDPAYRLGRLFAVLEKAQSDALPGIKATIRDRYYSAASATPQAVFPRLLRSWQHHLGALENVGQRINYDKLAQEILGPLETFPAHLDLAGQGHFALGYYHQRNALYKPAGATDSEQQENTPSVA
ncbi:MAG: type I-C CRISPR-associated protein Cas8c/Csd1 [Candidatus Dadabacteria bacterium]|nr:MAG: type I-C CRISPR-associated protein Cas8c/Csd1 [Candidatus Dadabacteria bacterium]